MTSYAGVGSRSTPPDVLELFTAVACRLGVERGWVLRSGCAPGADTAFERGALCALPEGPVPELFLPWPRFEGRVSVYGGLEAPTEAAFDLAAAHHPAWARLSQGARRLHARNCHQVLGAQLDSPCDRVICWTEGGSGRGGTGQAIRLARAHDVPVWDAGCPSVLARLRSFVQAG